MSEYLSVAVRSELPALLRKLKAEGKRIIGYGASAKGNTLLNTCGISTKELDYIIDNTPFKQGKIAPGSWIPVRPPTRNPVSGRTTAVRPAGRPSRPRDPGTWC